MKKRFKILIIVVMALSKGLGLVSDGTGVAQNTAKQILNLFH